MSLTWEGVYKSKFSCSLVGKAGQMLKLLESSIWRRIGVSFRHWISHSRICLCLCICLLLARSCEEQHLEEEGWSWRTMSHVFVFVFSLLCLFSCLSVRPCELQHWGLASCESARRRARTVSSHILVTVQLRPNQASGAGRREPPNLARMLMLPPKHLGRWVPRCHLGTWVGGLSQVPPG